MQIGVHPERIAAVPVSMLMLGHVGIAQRSIREAELRLVRHLTAEWPPLRGRPQEGDCSIGILPGLSKRNIAHMRTESPPWTL